MGNRTGVIIAILVLVLGAGALIVYSSMGLAQFTGEICIRFNGREECRVASGVTREDAIATATEMACATLASGMTQRINCSRTQPSSVNWLEE